MTLTITTYDNTIKFTDGSISRVYRRDINLKRYIGSQKLEILSDSKQNFAVYTIDFTKFSAVTINGSPITTIALLESGINDWINDGSISKIVDQNGNELNFTNNAMDVAYQDQTTRPIIAKFNRVEQSTTLANDASKGDTSIVVTSATGISVGKYIILFNPTVSLFLFARATDITGAPTIVLDSSLDSDFPAGTFVDVAETNLKSIGSLGSPIIYGLRGTGAPPGVDLSVDITRLIFTATANSAVDLTTFVNLAKLTNGLVLRRRNDVTENIFNIKDNTELAALMFDFAVQQAVNPVQGIDGFVSRLTFAGANKIGVAIRLPIGDDLEILVQDDISTAQSGDSITNFEITAEGHIVE
jgi:hypothetical protein